MNCYPATEETIRRAADVLSHGGIVAFPTETVYGLGADAFNPIAVARIFEAKRRPHFDPLIVHIAGFDEIDAVARDIPGAARLLADAFWPGPLTLVLPKRDRVPDIVTAGLPTVAVRMPANDVALSLIRLLGRPVAAPSANPFGYLSPTCARHVAEQLGNEVDMILDGGQCAVGVESTIVKIDDGSAELLRPGGLPAEEIERIIGMLQIAEDPAARIESPGQLKSHYAPKTPVRIVGGIDEVPRAGGIGVLAFTGTPRHTDFSAVEILSPSGDLREAAARLFLCLHNLDSRGVSVIYAESVPETGLGLAIMNRLRRAAARADL